MACDEETGKMTISDFYKARQALENAKVRGEKLVMTPEGLYSLEDTPQGTLWHRV